MAISSTQPSEVQVATQSNWISSNAAYNMLMPQNDRKEAHPWGSQDITGLVMKLGGVNYVQGNYGRHFEEDRLSMVIHATGTTVGSLGAVTYTIVSGDTITSWPPVEEPYIATGTGLGGPTLVPVRVHETLVFKNASTGVNGVRGKVTAVSGNTFTCTPENTTDLPTMTSTDEIYSLGVSVPEGYEGDINSQNWRENVVYWNSEIMAEEHKSTGTAMVQETWVPFTYNGKTMYSWWFKGQQNAFKMFRNYREMKWIMGQSVTNTTTLPTNYSAQYQQTTGLIPLAQAFGNNATYDLTTGMTLDDFQTIVIDNINKNSGATENALYTSINTQAVFEGFIRPEMQNGGVQYNAFNGDEKQYVNFGFSSWKVLNYTFHSKVYELFNNPTFAGYIYNNFAFWVPMENNMYKVDGETEKVDCPPMRINYLKQGNTSREWIETLTGGAIAAYTSKSDTATIKFLSENAFELFGQNRFGTVRGVNL